MDRMNCFNPYVDKPKEHEDRLTRSFLVVLQYSPMVQSTFINLIRDEQLELVVEGRLEHKWLMPPAFSSSESGGVHELEEVKTQKTGLPTKEGKLVSVLLTGKPWEGSEQPLSKREGNHGARYDGTAIFSDNWLLTIENKPEGTESERQLNPALSEEHTIEVCPEEVAVEWRTVLVSLSGLLEVEAPLAEKGLIGDFISFVEDSPRFKRLFPFRTFGQCKDNKYLLRRRSRAILKSTGLGNVQRRKGFEDYVSVDGAVKDIYLYPRFGEREDEWRVLLGLYPGNTKKQADKLYSSLDFQELKRLAEHKDWDIHPDLTFRYAGTKCHSSKTPLSLGEYTRIWQESQIQWGRRDRNPDNDFRSVISDLNEYGLLKENDESALTEHFTETDRGFMDISPGLSLHYSWDQSKAINLDRVGEFVQEFKKRVKEALACWGQSLPAATG